MDEKIYNALFGARVKHYRERAGITQAELADKMGYTSHAAISRIENGAQAIPLSKLPDLCIHLNVSPHALLGLEEKDKNIWVMAEKMNSDRAADLQRFIEIYLRMMDGQ